MQFNLSYPQKRTDLYLEDFPVSFGSFATSRFGEGVDFGPTSSLSRMFEQGELHMQDEGADRDPLSVGDLGANVPTTQRPDLTPISQEEGRTRLAEAGFPGLVLPEEGTTQEYVDWLIGRQQAEAARQSLRMRTPDTLGYAAAGFGLDLLSATVDPLNAAAAFATPIGASARLASSAGARAAARFRAGALGAGTESIMTEPFVYAQQQLEQMDYTLYDSLANVTIGAVAGGALRSVGGFTADYFRRRAQAPTPVSQAVSEAVQPPTRPSMQRDDLILANLRKTDEKEIMQTALKQFFNDQPVSLDAHIDVLRMRELGQNTARLNFPSEDELFDRFRQEQFRAAQQMDLTNQTDITLAQRAVNEAVTDLRRIEASREPLLAEATSKTQKKKVHQRINKEIERAQKRVDRAEQAALATSSTKRALKHDQMMREGRMPEELKGAYKAYKDKELADVKRMRETVANRGRMTPMSAAVKRGIDDLNTNARQDVVADKADADFNEAKMRNLPDDDQLFSDIEDLNRELREVDPELDIDATLREIDPTYRDKTTIADSFQRLAACL